MLLGLIINPIAGMGGRVGLKGTDGDETLEKAIALGAEPRSEDRARQTLTRLKRLDVEWVTWGGAMGEDLMKQLGFRCIVLEKPLGVKTTKEDTIEAAKAMVEKDVALIVFAGGDGTAVDIVKAIDQRVPLLGIPSGVKMYSAVFSVTPLAASEIVKSFVDGEAVTSEREIMDIDEDAYRDGILKASIKGFAVTPQKMGLVLSEKVVVSVVDENLMKESIAERVIDEMETGSMYILGPGSTVKTINERLGLGKSLLGVDLVRDGRIVALDVNEDAILDHLNGDTWIIVSPLGGQGSLFGHGNQQISPTVIRRVGVDYIVVLATPVKLSGLKVLAVDTGDPELDEELHGYMKVITGMHEARLVKVV